MPSIFPKLELTVPLAVYKDTLAHQIAYAVVNIHVTHFSQKSFFPVS